MTTTATTAHRASARPADSGRWLIWAAGLIVAAGAAVATAHGLYRVALAATVPPPIGWLYPLITDGLALVAYAATTRLTAGGRRYAWAVVVLAAGLSGLAQASYLAIGVHTAPVQLRFGVGAWPAVAAAITAHLLYLLAARPTAVQPDAAVQRSAVRPDGLVRPDVVQADAVQPTGVRLDTAVQHRPAGQRTHAGGPGPVVQPDHVVRRPGSDRLSGPPASAGASMPARTRRSLDDPLSRPTDPDAAGLPPSRRAADHDSSAVRPAAAVRSGVVQPVHPGAVHPRAVQPAGVQPVQPVQLDAAVRPDPVRAVQPEPPTPGVVHPVVRPAAGPVVRAEHPLPRPVSEPAGDRARAAALAHQDTHGVLPSVSELVGLADVARGTAANALRQLRDPPTVRRPGLQIVHGDETTGTNP